TNEALWTILDQGRDIPEDDFRVARIEMRKRLDAHALQLRVQISRSLNEANVLPGAEVTASVERVGPNVLHWAFPSKYDAIYSVSLKGSIPIGQLADG